MLDAQRIERLLMAALECSVYVAPTDPGLFVEELLSVGARLDLQAGEIGDALQTLPVRQVFGGRLLPDGSRILAWIALSIPQTPDYRNWSASEFIHIEMKDAVRAHGTNSVRLERSMLVERAVARGIPKVDAEAAITIDILTGHFLEKDGLLSYVPGHERWPLPSEQRKPSSAMQGQVNFSEARAAAYPIVKDVIERRFDGRASNIEPLDAFAEKLDYLGYSPFRLWWKQTVGELRQGNVQSAPLSVTVLSASLVEGALTLVVRHARSCGLAAFASDDFGKDPKSWRIDDLVKSAARGGADAILDHATRLRAEWLIHARQRIHAGRMLSEYPGGPPDLRPEMAREARLVADLITRCVLEWIERHPPSVKVAL